jgi:hypothetical protein
MNMTNLNFLDSDHPSINTPAAAFVFQAKDGILFVEANTNLAVQAMELLCEDGEPADNLELMGVFRDYGMIGIRNDNFFGMDYVDFLAKVADQRKLASIPNLKECIAASLSDEDREHMARIIKGMKSTPTYEDDASNDRIIETTADSVEECDEESEEVPSSAEVITKLTKAFTGLGFPKKTVKEYLTKVDSRKLVSEPLESLVREGLRNLGI